MLYQDINYLIGRPGENKVGLEACGLGYDEEKKGAVVKYFV